MYITIELKEQRELGHLRDRRLLDQDAVAVLLFQQDICPEPFRDQGDLQVAGITVVGIAAEVDDTVRIEG